MGYSVSLNLMATERYTKEELESLCTQALEASVDYIYVADSFGTFTIEDVENYYSIISSLLSRLQRMSRPEISPIAFLMHSVERWKSGITLVRKQVTSKIYSFKDVTARTTPDCILLSILGLRCPKVLSTTQNMSPSSGVFSIGSFVESYFRTHCYLHFTIFQDIYCTVMKELFKSTRRRTSLSLSSFDITVLEKLAANIADICYFHMCKDG